MIHHLNTVRNQSTYFDCQHDDGESSCCVNVRLKVVDHRGVTALQDEDTRVRNS